MRHRLTRLARKFIFWSHLIAGVTAGLVILLLAVTGLLLAYERQIQDWADGLSVSSPAGQSAIPLETLTAKAAAENGGASPSAITVSADPAAPVAFGFGREKTLHYHPYTGENLGEGAKKLHDAFHFITALHRWLALSDAGRDTGKLVTGSATLVFLFLVLSGLYLWWPGRWTWHFLKRIVWFDKRLTGRAKNWNWHNVFGFWACVPLFFITITGLIMSFTWANNLLFTMTGNEPPPPRTARGGGPGGGPPGAPRPGGGNGPPNQRREGGPSGEGRRQREGGGREAAPLQLAGLNQALQIAQGKIPDWQTISIRFAQAPGAPTTFSITSSHRGRPDKRVTLELDLASGQEVKFETFAKNNLGQKLRQFTRWIHTGEAGGILGQTLSGLSACAAIILVWTGFSLSWERFTRRKKKRGV